MKCLDSTFLIDFLNNDEGAIKKYNEIDDVPLMTTTTCVFEVLFGFYRKKGNIHERIKKFKDLTANLEIAPFDEISSEIASKIASELVEKGMNIEINDYFILGSMLSKDCNTIITRNAKHFARIKEIKVETY